MKYELKISRLAVVCVICTSAVLPAFGAASVRSLGGAGTYTSASSAAASKPATGGTARAGSLRVTPSASKPTASVSGTTGASPTTSRLSIGKYLGGGTSVSGGSSIKNQTTGSTSVSGGSMNPGGASSGDVKELTKRVDDLEVRVNNSYDKDDVDGALGGKQDVLNPKDKYVVVDGADIYLDVENLSQALQDSIEGTAGADGREVVIDTDAGGIKWQYVGDGNKWTYLASWEDLKGEKGDAGTVDPEVVNKAVADAVAAADFVTSADLADYAKKTEVPVVPTAVSAFENDAGYLTAHQSLDGLATKEELATKANSADVYTKADVDTKVQAAVTGGVEGLEEVLKGKADKNYVDAQVAYVTGDTDLNTKALTQTKNLDKGQGAEVIYDYPVRDVRVDSDGHTVLVKHAPIGASGIADNANIKITQMEERVGKSLDKADNSVQKTGLVQYVNVGDTAEYAVSNNAPSEKAVSQALANTASKDDIDTLTEMVAADLQEAKDMVDLAIEAVDSKADKTALDATNKELSSLTDEVLQVMEDVEGKANAADVYTKTEVYNKTEVDDKVAEITAGNMDEALKSYAKTEYVDTELAKKADKDALGALAAKNEIETGDIADGAVTKPKLAQAVQNTLDNAVTTEGVDMSKNQILAIYGGEKVWLEIADEQ